MKPFQERFQRQFLQKSGTKKYFFSFHNLLSGSESKQDNKMSSTKELVFESNKTVVLTSYCDSYCL